MGGEVKLVHPSLEVHKPNYAYHRQANNFDTIVHSFDPHYSLFCLISCPLFKLVLFLSLPSARGGAKRNFG